jgi:hypothetical protein
MTAASLVVLAAACTPSLDEVITKHRDAVNAVFAQIKALDGTVNAAPALTEDRVDVAPGSVVLDGPDSNALYLVSTDVAAPEHSDSTTTGATFAGAAQACGEALRGEFHGTAVGAEALLSQCGRAKYLLVQRAQVDEAAQMVGADSYSGGHYAGDVLLFRLADGAALGGFRVEAASSGSVMAHTDQYGGAKDAGSRLESDMSANAFVAIDEKLRKYLPGSIR